MIAPKHDLEGIDDPFENKWEDIVAKNKRSSEYGEFDSYDIKVFIVKGNDELRQELMAMQFMKQLQKIFKEANINIFLRPYEILVTSNNSGLIGNMTQIGRAHV